MIYLQTIQCVPKIYINILKHQKNQHKDTVFPKIHNLNSKSRSFMPKANKLQQSSIFIGNMTRMIKIM